MSEMIESTVNELRQAADESRKLFGSLSAEQLNWKPASNSWSVAQCLDHIILTNEQMALPLTRKIDGERNSLWETCSPFTGYLGRFLLKSMKADEKKFKAPSQTIVPPSDLPGDIVEKFEANIESVVDLVDRAARLDARRTVLTSPFMGLMTYRLGDGIEIMAEHTKRHIRQAKRVLETEGFPK